MRRWDMLADRFMASYSAEGKADGTITAMRREWDRWGCWLKGRRPRVRLDEVSPELITNYIRSQSKFHAKSTQYSLMSRLGMIGDFLVKEEVWRENPLTWMKRPRLDSRHRLPRRIDESALAKIWDSAARTRESHYRHLWLAVLGVLYGGGLRRGEIVALDLSNFDAISGTLLVFGKTPYERRIQLPDLAWRCIEVYLPRRQNVLTKAFSSEPALFVNKFGRRLSAEALSGGIQRIASRAGFKITLHQFRHTCASQLLADGVRLPYIQRHLGHRTIQTTMRYQHIAGPELRRAIEKHPINQLRPQVRPTGEKEI